MRIGLLGGTFDPPHVAHLSLAKAALDTLELDEVILVPAARNPQKRRSGFASPEQRLEMARLLAQEESRLSVSNIEVSRHGASYTVETLRELQMAQPAQYWLLMGADALASFPGWKQADRLIRLCRLGVAIRPPITEAEALAPLSFDFRRVIDWIPMPSSTVSSSKIREDLLRGKPVEHLLTRRVWEYIASRGLYGYETNSDVR